MKKDEIAANIVIAMMQNNHFTPASSLENRHQEFVSAVCDAYKQVYKAITEAEQED